MRLPAALAVALAIWAVAATARAGTATASSGIAGRIVAAPTCPVEMVPPQPRCAPRPLVATVRIRRVGSRVPSKVVGSDTEGHFRVRLAPGTYIVRPLPINGSPFPRPPAPVQVQVRAGRFTHIELTYDTGIR